MIISIAILTFIFGSIIGSFLNVVILRMNTGKGIGGRSQCFSCGETLSWYELIPMVSFLIQRAKCRSCKSRISWQYFLVEFSTGLLFAGIGIHFAPLFGLYASNSFAVLQVLFWMILASVGVVISVYDIKHTVIDITGLLVFIVLCVIGGFFNIATTGSFMSHLIGMLVVPFPFLVMWIVSRGKLIGFGDIEIMAGIGFLLGTVSGYSALTLSFWVGAVISIGWVVAARRRNKHRGSDTSSLAVAPTQIPFAPFLFLGIYLVSICGLDIFARIVGMMYH